MDEKQIIVRAPEQHEYFDRDFKPHRGQLLSWSFLRKRKNNKTYFIKPVSAVTQEQQDSIRSWGWKIFITIWPDGRLKNAQS